MAIWHGSAARNAGLFIWIVKLCIVLAIIAFKYDWEGRIVGFFGKVVVFGNVLIPSASLASWCEITAGNTLIGSFVHDQALGAVIADFCCIV